MKSLSTILTAATWITAVTAAPRSFRLPGGGRVTFEPFQSDSLSTHADELAQQAPLLSTAGMPVVDDHYIVVLKKAIDTEGLTAHHTWLAGHVSASASAIGVNEGKKARVRHLYDMNSYKGYSGEFDEETISQIRASPDVDYVERDSVVHTMAFNENSVYSSILTDQTARRVSSWIDKAADEPAETPSEPDVPPKEGKKHEDDHTAVQKAPTWGLDRLDQRALPLDKQYFYPKTSGEGVDVYIVDTGVNIAHNEFEGRARWGKTIPAGDPDKDGNGHGTHVAGTIGGKTYGVAKKASIVAVKVLRSNGSGTLSDVIKGVSWVAEQHKNNLEEAETTGSKPKKSVANLSLGGGKSRAMDAAVNEAVKVGVHFAVAAGNDDADACDYSPAGAEKPVSVGATKNTDDRAWFSNHGKCVDILAPGVDITSAWKDSKTATNTISGTSMAAPHVAGVMALYLGDKDYTPDQLKAVLIKDGTKGVIDSLPKSTPNILLYVP